MGQTYQSTVLDASADDVWNALRDFHDFSWSKVVEQVDGEGSPHEVGARRVLNGVFHETLLELDDEERILLYSIDEGPPPVSSDHVSDYVGRIRVSPVTEGGGSFVEWSSSWNGNEEETAEFCHGIYVALLGELKEHFG